MPVTRINNMPVGNGKPGPMCATLLKRWSEIVGLDIVAQMRNDI